MGGHLSDAAVFAAVLSQVAWVGRLAAGGLLLRYKALTGYFLIGSLGAASYLMLRTWDVRLSGESAYYWVYAVGRPLAWLCLLGILHSVFAHLVWSYKGLRQVGRIVFGVSVAAFFAVLILVFVLKPYPVSEPKLWGKVWLANEQSVHIAVAFCLIALLATRRFFRLSLCQNAQTVLISFGVYFVGYAFLLVVRSYLGEHWNDALNLVGGALTAGCAAFGAYRFSPAGETVVADVRLMEPDGVRAEKLRLARERLETVNFELMRALAK